MNAQRNFVKHECCKIPEHMMTTVTEMMAPQLYELQDGHYTFYNLTDGHHTKCLNLIQSTTKISFCSINKCTISLNLFENYQSYYDGKCTEKTMTCTCHLHESSDTISSKI